MRLVIIGSGNVADVLLKKFVASKHKVLQVAGRNSGRVSLLAERSGAMPCTDLAKIDLTADIYLIAVADNAVVSILEQISGVPGVIAHTAGSVAGSARVGVFYPLQTLRKELEYEESIPILINAATDSDLLLLENLARSISNLVEHCTDEQRAQLHLAATVVNNFTNHLFALAYQYCKNNDLPFSMLLPLMRQTVKSASAGEPAKLQTGAAVRRDLITMQKHLELLKDHPQLTRSYRLFSESIQNT